MRLQHVLQRVINFFAIQAVRDTDIKPTQTQFALSRARQMDDIHLNRFTGHSKLFKKNQRKERAASNKRKARKLGHV